MDNVFDGGGNSIVGGEWGVYDDAKTFYLEVCLVQSFEGTAIIKVMIKWHDEVRVGDGGDKGRVFGRGQE